MVKDFEKVFTPFWKTFLRHKQLFDAKVLIKRLSSFILSKIWSSDTCFKVKRCTNLADPISLNENLPKPQGPLKGRNWRKMKKNERKCRKIRKKGKMFT